MAIPHLKPEHLHQIGAGAPVAQAPIGIVGPGTGLGVASLVWDGARYVPIPGEGGHVTMAAQTQREFDIFRTLHYKYRHVSAERVCSGKGLLNIYNAIRILEGRDDLPDRTPEEISALALSKACETCEETLDLMMGFLGMVAGNLALTLGAHGGIYVGGGIVQKLGEAFFTSRFRKQFLSKGRLVAYLDPIPTYAILHPYPAFVGLHAELKTLV
ncbi:MAG TPA: glucokinase, partial [Alphaproteobacteria bacterium]|nr:glucokinase [Alphaproteobacteria bacterium]